MYLRDYIPALRYGAKITSQDTEGVGNFDRYFGTNVWYVDGTSGADTNGGDFDHPFATIQKGIDSASRQDTIYIRALHPDTDASDSGQYVENLSIPFAKDGLKLIGVGTSGTRVPYYGPKVKNASAGALLTVLAAGVHLEGIQFNATRNSGTYGILFDGIAGYVTKAGSCGFTVVNCMIKNGDATYGGIYIVGGYGGLISNCQFQGCLMGITIPSNTLPCNGHTIEYCNFKNINGATATSHIKTSAGGNHDIAIDHCNFDLGTNLIYMGNANTGLISNCCFVDTVATLANSTGLVRVPASETVAVTGCWGGVSLAVIQSAA